MIAAKIKEISEVKYRKLFERMWAYAKRLKKKAISMQEKEST
jgi:hypothetical protein